MPPSRRPAGEGGHRLRHPDRDRREASRCRATNDRGPAGTSATGARSTSTPRRSSARAVSRPRRRSAASPRRPAPGRRGGRRPAESTDGAALLIGDDQDRCRPRPAAARRLAVSAAPGAPSGRSAPMRITPPTRPVRTRSQQRRASPSSRPRRRRAAQPTSRSSTARRRRGARQRAGCDQGDDGEACGQHPVSGSRPEPAMHVAGLPAGAAGAAAAQIGPLPRPARRTEAASRRRPRRRSSGAIRSAPARAAAGRS